MVFQNQVFWRLISLVRDFFLPLTGPVTWSKELNLHTFFSLAYGESNDSLHSGFLIRFIESVLLRICLLPGVIVEFQFL